MNVEGLLAVKGQRRREGLPLCKLPVLVREAQAPPAIAVDDHDKTNSAGVLGARRRVHPSDLRRFHDGTDAYARDHTSRLHGLSRRPFWWIIRGILHTLKKPAALTIPTHHPESCGKP